MTEVAMSVQDLQDKYAALVESARAEKAKHAGGEMPAEAKSKIDTILDEAMKVKDGLEVAVAEAERDAKWRAVENFAKESAGRLPAMGQPAVKGGLQPVQFKDRGGKVREYTPLGSKAFGADFELKYTDVFRRYLSGEKMTAEDQELAQRKALSVGVDAAGGFLVPSEVFMAELIQALADETFMRRESRVLPTLSAGASIAVPAADSALDAAEWTVELATATADTSTPFGRRRLSPHPLAKLVKVSNTLLRMSPLNVEAWVRDQVVERIGAALESAYMTGTGAGQPEGLFTSTNATLVAADVTAGSATDVSYEDLLNVVWAVKSQYRRNASWIVGRTILKELNLLTDGIGRPLLWPDPSNRSALTLMGYPLHESEYCPQTSTAGLYVAALGDWRRVYWIADSLNIQIQVLKELYAADNETGYIARIETDGMVVDGNGAARLKMA